MKKLIRGGVCFLLLMIASLVLIGCEPSSGGGSTGGATVGGVIWVNTDDVNCPVYSFFEGNTMYILEVSRYVYVTNVFSSQTMTSLPTVTNNAINVAIHGGSKSMKFTKYTESSVTIEQMKVQFSASDSTAVDETSIWSFSYSGRDMYCCFEGNTMYILAKWSGGSSALMTQAVANRPNVKEGTIRIAVRDPIAQTYTKYTGDEVTISDIKKEVTGTNKVGTVIYDGTTPLGVVFWVDPADNSKYKIVALKDAGSNMKWGIGTVLSNGVRNTGDGKANLTEYTNLDGSNIATSTLSHAMAACACWDAPNNKVGTTIGEWYLPARDELDALYLSRSEVNTALRSLFSHGAIALDSKNYWPFYWSSTYSNYNRYGWSQDFVRGIPYEYCNDNDARAIWASY